MKYIILGSYRSGTSTVNESLCQHPDLKAAYEILHPNCYDEVGGIPNYRSVMKSLYGIEQFQVQKSIWKSRFYPPDEDWIGIPHWRLVENVDLKKLFDWVFERYNGFKVMYQQLDRSSPSWDYFLGMPELKVIHMVRRNYLESLVSYLLAHRTNVWNITPQEPKCSDEPLYLPPRCCRMYFEYMEFEIEHFTYLFEDHDCLTIEYETLFQWDHTINSVQEFLGVKPIKLPSKYAKRTDRSMQALISNFDELREKFKDTRWSHFFELKKRKCLMI